MFPSEEKLKCSCSEHPQTILYNILSCGNGTYLEGKQNLSTTVHSCRCEQRRTVGLKNPKITRQVASNVLVKTICFMRSLPSFGQLPSGDQTALLRDCWVPVFVLGLAQAKIEFEVTDVPHSSILRQILLGQGRVELTDGQLSLAGVHQLKTCLCHLWDLDLSPKEYAYLKGTMLFNPAVKDLRASSIIEGFQQEAQRALQEVTLLLHPHDSRRFRRTLQAASAAQTVSQTLVTELFFKPVIGGTSLLHLLTELLFVQDCRLTTDL